MLSSPFTWLRGRHISAGVSRLLPGSSRHFGPPRAFGPAAGVVAASGGAILASEPGLTLTLPSVHCHSAGPDGLPAAAPTVPSNVVFELPDAVLRHAPGYVVTRDDVHVFDASIWGRRYPRPGPEHTLYQFRKTRPLRRLPGLTISIASDFAWGGYGHLVHDSLSRLRLLQLASVDATKADWIFCPRQDTATVRALTRGLGFPEDRLLNFDPATDLVCERLCATTYPHAIGWIAARDAEFLAGLGERWRTADTPARRVYLSRHGYKRNFENEAPVLEVLRDFGFEIIDPSSGADVLAACANASVVAGIDGANLASLAFMPPTGRILLFYPETEPPLPYFVTMGAYIGRQVHILHASPKPGAVRVYHDDFTVDPAAVRATLAEICSGLPDSPGR